MENEYVKQVKNRIEGFSQYSSLSSNGSNDNNNLSKTVLFDTNWYIRDGDKPIILNNHISLPVIRYGYYSQGSYDYLVGEYFRHRIYPIEQLQLNNGLDTIYQFINGDIDIAFLNEELLSRFIKRDCKYLSRLIINNLGLENVDLSDKEQLDRIYPIINFSAIGVGYHQYLYLIVNNYSNIIEFLDIQNKVIGILDDSYYIFMKLIAAYDLDITKLNISRVVNLEDLIENFQNNKFDGIFLVINPKNQQIVRMTRNIKCRYIHIQKRIGLDARNNLKNLIPDQQGTGSLILPSPPNINRQEIYAKSVLEDLKTENIRETFNDLMRKYFQHVRPFTVDLNKFHKSGNIYTYLETYSSRMILVVRDDIPRDRVKYITHNYINELQRMRDQIDRDQFIPTLNNFSSIEFDYNELVSFDSIIPLAKGSREVYEKEGLITYADNQQCKV